VVVPIALYPAYRVTAADPASIAYARHFLALPFLAEWANVVLWQLLRLTALGRFAAPLPLRIGSLFSAAGRGPPAPGQAVFCRPRGGVALAYVPLAVAFTPWAWGEHGPFALQFWPHLLYTVFYFRRSRGWINWFGAWLARSRRYGWRALACLACGALASFCFLDGTDCSRDELQGIAGTRFAKLSSTVASHWPCAGGCFSCGGLPALRHVRTPPVRQPGEPAPSGFICVHYVFVVWLQYGCSAWHYSAVAKGTLVFARRMLLAGPRLHCVLSRSVRCSLVRIRAQGAYAFVR